MGAMTRAAFTNRALLALLASFAVASALGESPEPTKVRIATWNLEWFPNGSAHDAAPEVQAQRIAAAADVLRPINADIILLQEVRDYEACARLGEAIAPGMYHVAICSAFKEPFQSGLGKQQVAILSKYVFVPGLPENYRRWIFYSCVALLLVSIGDFVVIRLFSAVLFSASATPTVEIADVVVTVLWAEEGGRTLKTE
jgi:Endonuclease/Exonuclease/phosphatase family